MRSALILVAACGGSTETPKNVVPPQPHVASSSCVLETTHPLPAIGSTFDDLPAPWSFPDAPNGRAGNGVVAHDAVDEQAGQGAMLFRIGEHPYKHLGALAPPGEYLLDMDHVCPDGFVVKATSAGPPPKFVRVIVDEHQCSIGAWQATPPDC
ncbi:MAG: hypothetical protein QM831_25400 [Kofleriaceae bacterium]